MDIKTTQEYFNLTAEQLSEVKNEYGYTKEECKLFDAAEKVSILANLLDAEEDISWMIKNMRMECKAILSMINGCIAVLYI